MAVTNKHILIENVRPSVNGGRYAAKAIAGESCVVQADVFRDGHVPVSVTLRWRSSKNKTWLECPMTDDGNDCWAATFPLAEPGLYEFSIHARSAEGDSETSDEYRVVADRPLARFSAWYEFFVRSQGKDPGKGATFKEAEARLPDIKAMGFDVLYLAPIHPIGRTARKGPNNSLNAGPNDPGSPWAVGNENGGHTAVEPALGTLDDFDRFVAAAKIQDLDIALDFAPHCSPDHPWVKEHPDWFYRRADGTIKCHENPPFVYEDVYPLNFDAPSQKELYAALRDVFLFWAARGVKIFRVDNPHTKPVAFWEWVISEVKTKYPDSIFLGEAFTRPKMMKALSKAGFSQSYTYFIWRTTKQELIEYMTELSDPALASYFRPNFFPTTPDVLPRQLQNAGRAAFETRLALAATLSPSYGIVAGYELLENEAMTGTEEYANSEKYQVRVRDWEKPGNIKETVRKLNAFRRENPALQRIENVLFIETGNDAVIAYAKMTADKSNLVIVAVNLDPDRPQEATLQLPMDKLGFSWEATFNAQDIMTTDTITFFKSTRLRLDPATHPFQMFRVQR